jgi:hypothetical protein
VIIGVSFLSDVVQRWRLSSVPQQAAQA